MGDRMNEHRVVVAWGDCDPAGIIFYPNYFRMFNAATDALFETAGFPLQRLIDEFGTVGYPMINTGATFIAPNRFGDELCIQSRIIGWGRSSFQVDHRVFKGDLVTVEAYEKRVWATGDGAGQIRSEAIPDIVKGSV